MALDRHRRRRLWPPAEGNGAAVDDLAPVTGWEIARARFQSGRPLPRPMGSGAPKARPSPVAPVRSAIGASVRDWAEGPAGRQALSGHDGPVGRPSRRLVGGAPEGRPSPGPADEAQRGRRPRPLGRRRHRAERAGPISRRDIARLGVAVGADMTGTRKKGAEAPSSVPPVQADAPP